MGRPKSREPIDKDYEEFGKKIQELRKLHNLSQVELSKEIGISRTSIAEYETGSTRIPISALKTIAEFFNASVDDLIGLNLSPDGKESVFEKNIKKWKEVVGFPDFSEDELSDLINYAQFIVSKRSKK